MKRLVLLFILGVVLVILMLDSALARDQEVIIYCDNSYPPYSFEGKEGAAGIYTDIFKKVFSRMKGYCVTIKPVPWKRGLYMMEQGTGFALYPPYYRPETRPYMDYPVPVLDEGHDILCAADVAPTPSKNWPDDYAGLRIGINMGFSIPGLEKAKAMGVNIEEAVSNRANLLKLATGRIDGYINDKNAMLWELKRLRDTGEYNQTKHKKLVITANINKEQGFLGFTNRDNGRFAFKADFIKQFVAEIEKMKQEGELKAVLNSYIQ